MRMTNLAVGYAEVINMDAELMSYGYAMIVCRVKLEIFDENEQRGRCV